MATAGRSFAGVNAGAGQNTAKRGTYTEIARSASQDAAPKRASLDHGNIPTIANKNYSLNANPAPSQPVSPDLPAPGFFKNKQDVIDDAKRARVPTPGYFHTYKDYGVPTGGFLNASKKAQKTQATGLVHDFMNAPKPSKGVSRKKSRKSFGSMPSLEVA